MNLVSNVASDSIPYHASREVRVSSVAASMASRVAMDSCALGSRCAEPADPQLEARWSVVSMRTVCAAQDCGGTIMRTRLFFLLFRNRMDESTVSVSRTDELYRQTIKKCQILFDPEMYQIPKRCTCTYRIVYYRGAEHTIRPLFANHDDTTTRPHRKTSHHCFLAFFQPQRFWISPTAALRIMTSPRPPRRCSPGHSRSNSHRRA